MLFTLLFLFFSSAHAQELSELKELSKYNKKTSIFSDKKQVKVRKVKNKYDPTFVRVGLEEILSSPEELGVIKSGSVIYQIEDSKKIYLDKDIFIRFHRQPDEQGFEYIVSENGDITYKVETEYIHSIAQETNLYEPPHSYSAAPEIKRIHWDEKLNSKFEVSLAVSRVEAHYIGDLLNLESTPSGQMTQLGMSYLADWDWPIKVGLGAYYQEAKYDTDGKTTAFRSYSFGPIFKTKSFHPFNIETRIFTQMRYSPMAKVDVNISRGSTSFDFNTTDFLAGLEFPMKNRWGEFVISVFTHYQWMNLKNQEEIVAIESSNKANQAFGLGFSQVF